MSWVKESHLIRTFAELESATDNFKTFIGKGGFGEVYKGELSISGVITTVAVKRLDSKLTGQGLKEFLTEIQLLSGYKHQNLISLLGFCDEDKEKLLVYEYADHRSLDRYLSTANTSNNLTWFQRLKICVGAARGLDFLHNKVGEHHRVIHRDIKSANILLDYNWEAKISDLGLSKLGIANDNNSFLISNACGTQGYCDPVYINTGVLTKESDVYSFGVVLFEVLCGRFCIINTDDDRRFLAPLARRYYENKKIEEIVDPVLREQMDSNSLNTFAAIAHQCLLLDRGQRPSMSVVVEELEEALEFQGRYEFEKQKKLESILVSESDTDAYWEQKLPQDHEEIIKKLDSRVKYTSKKELFSLLREGILFDKRKRLFSIDKDGEKCEMISAAGFLDPDIKSYSWDFRRDLRFSKVAEFPNKVLNILCKIRTSMLSPGIMYTASLVFRFRHQPNEDFNAPKYVGIKWKHEELSVSSTHYAEWTEDRWLKIKMWHFINHKKNADFEIVLEEISDVEGFDESGNLMQGIEFQPVEMLGEEEIEGLQNESNMNNLSISDQDVDWEQYLPSDYQEIIQRSDKRVEYATKKELYDLLCEGILLIDSSKMWFSLCKSNGKKCHMLPAKEILFNDPDYERLNWISLPESRFGEAVQLHHAVWFLFTCKIRSYVLSSGTAYACYLVFKFRNNQHGADDIHQLQADSYLEGKYQGTKYVHLKFIDPMNIPTIKPKNDTRSHSSITISTPKIKRIHQMPNSMRYWMEEQRSDGWLEVVLYKSICDLGDQESYKLKVKLFPVKMYFSDIIIQGIEFRPM